VCGIAGKYNYDDAQPVDPHVVRSMCDAIAHRGPDDHGIFVDGPIGLGHRRLSIIDLSAMGHQPMASADEQLWITFNGEIYNFQSLRRDLELQGYSFRSTSDTEVILCLYREHGPACLKLLRGMFAFALWDRAKRQLLLARDRIGKKPLYYYLDDKTLIFGSELKSILTDPSVRREIDYQGFYDYFKYGYIPDPKTIYRSIRKLLPGHYLLCSPEGIKETKYWDLSFQSQSAASESALADDLAALLKESVRLRMISDVPLGAFLSGGIDSSAVVALMAGQQKNAVSTFTIGFDERDFDEVQFARTIAGRYATQHHEFTVKQNVLEVLDALVKHFDEPFADSSAVPTFYVSKVARNHVTVALAGDGGDENFAGYEKYHLDATENRIRAWVPRPVCKSLFPGLAGIMDRSHVRLAQRGATLLRALAADPCYAFYLTNTEFNGSLWDDLVADQTKKAIGDYDPYSITRQYYERADTDDHLSRLLYTDMKTYLPGDILVKVDRMSMAHSLEVRAPLLDQEVLEFVARIPLALKYRDGQKKYILKRAVEPLLPPETIHRKKMGFSVPLEQWFRDELRDVTASSLLAPDARVANYLRQPEIRRLWELHQAGKRDFGSILWTLLMFELWHRKFLG